MQRVPSNNPYQSPTFVAKTPDQWKGKLPEGYGGIGRTAYFLISISVGVVNGIVDSAAAQNNIEVVNLACLIISLVATVTLAALRLKNLGYRGLWAVGLFVPILNILVTVRCIAAPEGYADHKTLDTPGKVIVGIVLGLFALIVVAVLLA